MNGTEAMDGMQFAIWAYIIGLGLMWGYVVSMFLSGRRLARRQVESDAGSVSEGDRQ